MNYNANAGARQPGPKKIKRVSDVKAMGAPAPSPYTASVSAPNPYAPQPNYMTQSNSGFNGNPQNYGFNPQVTNEFNQYPSGPHYGAPEGVGYVNPSTYGVGQTPPPIGFNPPTQFSVLQQPIVKDMAMQYGQQMADAGKTFVNKEFEKYVPVHRLKYYFAVDTRYVVSKLRLLFFPFTHNDWSLKYEQENPVQPRYDLNAPDLYIPTMAYVSYVLLAGLILGMQNRFSPNQIGIQASSALAYSIFEIVVYWVTLYITSIQTSLKTLDLVAYSGYKYVCIIACLLISLIFKSTGYYICLVYCSLSLSFFLVRTLKALVLEAPVDSNYGVQPAMGYGTPSNQEVGGNKRRLYFLLSVSCIQPFLMWWLSFHLLPLTIPETAQILDL